MIFYYSATNNSKNVAQELCGRNENLISIIECVQKKNYIFEIKVDENIGFVIPTYFYGIPKMVEEFLKKIEIEAIDEHYKYLVLTCGLNTANAAGIFEKQLGHYLNAIYAVKMVDTYVPLHKIPKSQEIKIIMEKAQKDISKIKEQIQTKCTGDFNLYKGICPILMSQILYPFYLKGRKTKKFFTTDKCNGCGKCSKECIRGVISIVDKKPVWKEEQCELCLKCLHQCPKEAIEYGNNTKNKGRYKKG